MTNLDQHIAPAVQAEIASELDRLTRDHKVRILLAIESGSRAWGFPSPDSDYDVRFIYVHERDWYLTLTPGRDVIERPPSDELDIGGWDLRKALNLALKGNATLSEWLQSPLIYRHDEIAHQALTDFVRGSFNPKAFHYHYLNLGAENYRRNIAGRGSFKLKKYFYALRPALVLDWMDSHPGKLPPMDVPSLRAGLDLPEDLSAAIDDLIAVKSKTREAGASAPVPVLDDYITGIFTRAEKTGPGEAPTPSANMRAKGDALFRELLGD